MHAFRPNLSALIQAHPLYRGNLSLLSKDANLGRKYLSNLLNNDAVDRSAVGPGMFAMKRIAECLSVSLDTLALRDGEELARVNNAYNSRLTDAIDHSITAANAQMTERGAAPTASSLLRRHVRGGGRIEAFDDILQYCDVYWAPDSKDSEVRIKSVGEFSLASMTMGTANADVLSTALNKTPALAQKVNGDHLRAIECGPYTSAEYLDNQMPNRPVRVRIDYLRTILPVTDADGQLFVITHATLIAP